MDPKKPPFDLKQYEAFVTPSEGPTKRLYDEKWSAQYLGVQPSTLQAWRSRGGGPRFVKINGRICRYRLEDLDAWIAERLRNSTSDPGPRSGR